MLARKNSSREFQRATKAISLGTICVEKTTITPSSSAARPAAVATRAKPPLGSLSSGSTIISGTTARSCTTRIPIMTRLERVPSRPCDWMVFRATIVLDREMRPPNQTAWRHSQPSAEPRAMPRAMVRHTWMAPPASATARTGASSRNDTSRPSENSSSTTPSSASCSMSCATVGPPVNGPMMMPARM